MSSFSLNSKFNWIIFPFRAFQALTTKNQRENCLKCVNEHLEDDGKVVIQIFDPLPEIFKKWTELKNLDVRIWDKTTNKYVEFRKHMCCGSWVGRFISQQHPNPNPIAPRDTISRLGPPITSISVLHARVQMYCDTFVSVSYSN